MPARRATIPWLAVVVRKLSAVRKGTISWSSWPHTLKCDTCSISPEAVMTEPPRDRILALAHLVLANLALANLAFAKLALANLSFANVASAN